MATKTDNRKNQKTPAASVKKNAVQTQKKELLEIMDVYLDKRLGGLSG